MYCKVTRCSQKMEPISKKQGWSDVLWGTEGMSDCAHSPLEN